MPRTKKPTWTSLTVEAMRLADDFMSLEQLMVATGANGNQMRATLHWLQKAKVVDNVVSAGGLYWFLTGEDSRETTVDERTPEEPGTRRRRGRKPRETS
jgi:hypothetical protein